MALMLAHGHVLQNTVWFFWMPVMLIKAIFFLRESIAKKYRRELQRCEVLQSWDYPMMFKSLLFHTVNTAFVRIHFLYSLRGWKVWMQSFCSRQLGFFWQFASLLCLYNKKKEGRVILMVSIVCCSYLWDWFMVAPKFRLARRLRSWLMSRQPGPMAGCCARHKKLLLPPASRCYQVRNWMVAVFFSRIVYAGFAK